MSSYDERFSAESTLGIKPIKDLMFPSQIEWIMSLIEYVKNREELFLIIRVHPRDFPNQRDSVTSEHSKKLKEAFSQLPSNAIVNWPEEKISLYDLKDGTDVFLNAWSMAGVEMTILGKPVVIYSSELVAYPDDLNFIGKTIPDYFNKIELVLV